MFPIKEYRRPGGYWDRHKGDPEPEYSYYTDNDVMGRAGTDFDRWPFSLPTYRGQWDWLERVGRPAYFGGQNYVMPNTTNHLKPNPII